MERVLITGGTGFLGRATVRRFVENGYAVRVLTRGSWPFDANPRLERANGSMTNVHALEDAVSGCTIVVHLAAKKSDERDSVAVNADGTRLLCECAKRAGVKKIIYVSTQSAALRKRGSYGETKLMGETIVRDSGLAFVILRPSLVYGDSDAGVFSTIEKLSSLPFVPIFGDGKAVFRPIHVEDVATSIMAATTEENAIGKTLDLGGPDAVTFDDLVRRVQASRGLKRRIVHLPVWLGLLGASVLAALPRPPITRSNVLGGLESPPMDVLFTQDVLKFSPRPFSLPTLVSDRLSAMYISYVSCNRVDPIPELCVRFRDACAVHRIDPPSPSRRLLPYLDGGTRIWKPYSPLRKTLVVAAAVAECTPQGALAYLPKTSRMTGLILSVLATLAAGAWFMTIGTVLLLIPSIRRHAH